jgi:LacI family transcriptional regulator
MAQVKLQDIARICRVDLSTASRGIRGDVRVKSATRKKIQKTAERLGYRPNLLARNLAGGKTRTIWIILPSVDSSIDQRLVRYASHCANERDYTLFAALHDSENFGALATHSSRHYEQILQSAAQGMTDGILVIPRRFADDTGLLAGFARKEFPLVFLDSQLEGLNCPVVTTNNKEGARDLAQRCVEEGATGVVLSFEEANSVARARKEGASAALRECGVPFIMFRENQPPQRKELAHLGPCIAVLDSSQSGKSFSFFTSPASPLLGKRLLHGVFDEWIGEPAPAEKVFVAVQNCEALAKCAIDLLISRIENPSEPLPQITEIPLLEITARSASFPAS